MISYIWYRYMDVYVSYTTIQHTYAMYSWMQYLHIYTWICSIYTIHPKTYQHWRVHPLWHLLITKWLSTSWCPVCRKIGAGQKLPIRLWRMTVCNFLILIRTSLRCEPLHWQRWNAALATAPPNSTWLCSVANLPDFRWTNFLGTSALGDKMMCVDWSELNPNVLLAEPPWSAGWWFGTCFIFS